MSPSQAIEHLIAQGMTEQAIASKAGTTQSTVNRIRHGQQPSFDLGKSLVELAQQNKPRRAKAA